MLRRFSLFAGGLFGGLFGGLLACVFTGCGPLHMPMPPRLDADSQRAVDDAWNRASADLSRIDHQQLLDALMASQAYQLGVDRLHMRSEKHCAAGLVVMEIEADRAAPSEDCFTFTLYDDHGLILRHERYSREDIERTYKELFVELSKLDHQEQHGGLNDDQRQQRDALQARLNAAHMLFPEFDRDEATPDS